MMRVATEGRGWLRSSSIAVWFLVAAVLAPGLVPRLEASYGETRVGVSEVGTGAGVGAWRGGNPDGVEGSPGWYDGLASGSPFGPGGGASNLPVLEISAGRHPDLAENILHAQQAGHPDVLTHGGPAAANRSDALRILEDNGVRRVHGLSPDEYPFASSFEGGPGAWVGHIPDAQQRSQGGLISNFVRRNRIRPGDRYRVRITE